jgi:hypothetical protein
MNRVFALFFLLSFVNAKANEIFITLNPLSCLACTAGIYELNKNKGINKINIVMESVYQIDSIDINEVYELKRYPKLVVHYSDTLYKKLSSKDDAEIIIRNTNDEEVYRGLLKRLDLIAINSFFNHKSVVSIDTIRSTYINKNVNTIYMFDDYIVIDNIFNKWAVMDKQGKKNISFTIDETVKQELYKCLYRSMYNIKYPVVNAMILETPSFKPTIAEIKEWDQKTLLVNVTLKDYKKGNGNDTIISSENIIGKYNIHEKRFVSFYKIDEGLTESFNLWNIYINNQKYYAQGTCGADDRFCFLALTCDEKEKKIFLKRKIIFERPARYKTASVSSLEENNICINKNLLAFAFDNELIDIETSSRVHIPIAYKGGKYNEFEIRDIYEDERYYYILGLEEQNITATFRFSKTGNNVDRVDIGQADDVNKYCVRFYGSGGKVIYKPQKNDCLVIAEIKY